MTLLVRAIRRGTALQAIRSRRCSWLGGALLVLGGCDASRTATSSLVVSGEVRTLGAGTVRSWVQIDPAGDPLALGLTFSKAALGTLVARADSSFALALPHGVAGQPFDHLEVDWRGAGHAPDGVYDRPHLDVRFFLLPLPARAALRDSAAAVRMPELDFIPGKYVPLPGPLPRAGSRWTDAAAPELRGEPLTTALLYGFYDGAPTFLEVLVARALLEASAERRHELPLPRRYPRSGYYPTQYRLRYDAATREYSVALEGLVLRDSDSGARGARGVSTPAT